MDFNTFKNGQRYLFHIKPGHQYKQFRANLVDILYIHQGTIRVTKVQFANIKEDRGNIRNSTLVTMPLAWIEKLETLEEILDKEKSTTNKTLTLIPSEILLEVDGFL